MLVCLEIVSGGIQAISLFIIYYSYLIFVLCETLCGS